MDIEKNELFKGFEVASPGDPELKFYTLAAKTLAIFEFAGVFSKGGGSYARVSAFITDRAFCLTVVYLKFRCQFQFKTTKGRAARDAGHYQQRHCEGAGCSWRAFASCRLSVRSSLLIASLFVACCQLVASRRCPRARASRASLLIRASRTSLLIRASRSDVICWDHSIIKVSWGSWCVCGLCLCLVYRIGCCFLFYVYYVCVIFIQVLISTNKTTILYLGLFYFIVLMHAYFILCCSCVKTKQNMY